MGCNMKISDSLKLKLEKEAVEAIIIVANMEVHYSGCACSNGAFLEVVPIVDKVKDKDSIKNIEKYKLEKIGSINVYISDRIYKYMSDDTEICEKRFINKGQLYLKNFKISVDEVAK